ncbi:MAG: amidohydrolase [Bacteroidia bacterium]|jgi:predicted amidohydrolase|nr:amidohydrolase [Bacteroidia bacterium]
MQNDELHVAAVQTALHWENPEANRRHFSAIFREIATDEENPRPDLIVLPEMFSTGFSMAPERHAEMPGGPTTQWMQEQAALHNAVITGSIIVKEDNHYYNRLLWVLPNGSVEHYSKRHLFRMGGEDKHYTAGQQKLITQIKGFKVCPLVCYDLRFPVWSRNRFAKDAQDNLAADYDLLIYVANWPEARSFQWKALLRARAIENQAYLIGVNRIGHDGKDIPHNGCSALLNFKGEDLVYTAYGVPSVLRASFSLSNLEQFRSNFPAGMDADAFELK